jgi:hypothetical protein
MKRVERQICPDDGRSLCRNSLMNKRRVSGLRFERSNVGFVEGFRALDRTKS